MSFMRENVSILNHLYSVITGVVSYFLLVKINKLPVELAVILAGFLPLLINHFKDKINKIDDSTELGKLYKEFENLDNKYNDCKSKLGEKEALLIHLRTEITNCSTGRRNHKDTQELLVKMTRWFNSEVELNNVSNDSVSKLADYKRRYDQFTNSGI